jgi:hypothetical protein
MHITVQTREDVARDLVKDRPRLSGTRKLRAVLSELGLQLEPLHPGTSEPELATHFFITVPDAEAAEEVSRRLRESGAVEAAYVKPPGAAPFV